MSNSGKSAGEVARDLGINDSMLARWCHQLNQSSRHKSQGNARDEELARLRRELVLVKKSGIF